MSSLERAEFQLDSETLNHDRFARRRIDRHGRRPDRAAGVADRVRSTRTDAHHTRPCLGTEGCPQKPARWQGDAPRAAADERSRRQRATRALSPRVRDGLGPARDGSGSPRGAYCLARSPSPAAAKGRRRADQGGGQTPVRFIQKGPDEFLRFFAVFSAIFRLGFGSGAGEEGGWAAAIAGDGLPTGSRRRSAAAAAAARRERGGWLSITRG